MSNQYTTKQYTKDEIELVIKMYQDGHSITQIGKKLRRQKNNIKKILTSHNVLVENRDKIKYQLDEDMVVNLYKNGLNTEKIGQHFNVSKTPINRILKKRGILKCGNGNGKKILLRENQKNEIKLLYLCEYKNSKEISKIMNLSEPYIDKILSNSGYRRTKGESISLRQTGKKRSKEFIEKFTQIQRDFAKSGKRKQLGGVCKNFIVNNLICNGTYEKFYIEKHIIENISLPKKGDPINTPFGVYYPDFKNEKNFIEIKSDYTYDVLIGKKENKWLKKIDTGQFEKIKWVNSNIKPVEIIVVDKRNNKLIKKEIK
jgi:transposase